MRQFEQETNPVATLDAVMDECLRSMYEELATCDCYVREHEVVNLFVFGHLVPNFLKRDLDLRQIGIEYPVLKVREGEKSKRGARKDLVIWPRSARLSGTDTAHSRSLNGST